jgi:hypothetical protein
VERHQAALLKLNTGRDGMLQVNLGQLFLDLALTEVRIEILFEALRDAKVIEPQVLVKMLADRLHAESQQMEQLAAGPQIAIASGRVPRNG